MIPTLGEEPTSHSLNNDVMHGWNNDYSKEDKDILFCSKEECSAYEENWLQQSSHCQVETSTPRRASNRVKFETPAKDCACQFGGPEPPGTSLVPDQNVETICPSKLHKSPARPSGEMCKKVSESLLAPTQTSRAKQQALVEKEMKHKARPITERAVSYTRYEKHVTVEGQTTFPVHFLFNTE